jgi:TRAP-type uncharacterized transport system substrate-binding protein
MAAVLLLGVATTARAEDAPQFFRIGTAATTGTYFQIGAEIANAISKPPGSRACARGGSCGVEGLVAVAQATEGSIENVIAVGQGQLEAAFVQADVAAWAYDGKIPAAVTTAPKPAKDCRGVAPPPPNGTALLAKAGAIRNLRAIASLYPEAVHVVARAGIRSIADLKGKTVGLGEAASGTLVEARLALSAEGLQECQLKAQYLRLADAAATIEQDKLDAFFLMGGAPVPAIIDAASMQPLHLLAIAGKPRDALLHTYPFITAATIPGATYPGIDAETQTIAVPTLLVVSATVSDDLVYGITKALWQDATRRSLDNGHPAGKAIRIENALQGIAIPLHPGAARYYTERGMTVPTTP